WHGHGISDVDRVDLAARLADADVAGRHRAGVRYFGGDRHLLRLLSGAPRRPARSDRLASLGVGDHGGDGANGITTEKRRHGAVAARFDGSAGFAARTREQIGS